MIIIYIFITDVFCIRIASVQYSGQVKCSKNKLNPKFYVLCLFVFLFSGLNFKVGMISICIWGLIANSFKDTHKKKQKTGIGNIRFVGTQKLGKLVYSIKQYMQHWF